MFNSKKSFSLFFIFLLFPLFTFGNFIQVYAEPIIDSISVGSLPHGLDVNPYTNEIYVTNLGSNSVSVIDGYSHSVVDIAVQNQPSGLSVNTSTNMVYVANQGSNSVSVIDGSSKTVVKTIPVGSRPDDTAVNKNTNLIYVSNAGSDNVDVIDGSTNTVIPITIMVGNEPTGIKVNSKTNMVYVTNQLDNTVSVINGTTNSVVQTILVGVQPVEIDINEITNTIYVVNSHADSVSVINGVTNTVIDTIVVGDSPLGVSVDPSINIIYIVNFASNSVSVIDGSTNSVVNTINVSDPREVSVSTFSHRVYVSRQLSNSVSVIDITDPNSSRIASLETQTQDHENRITTLETQLGTTNTWITQPSNTQKDLLAVDFVDPNNGWVVGFDTTNYSGASVFHTSDGGLNWNSQATFPANGNFGGGLFDVDFVDSMHGYISGASQSGCGECFTIKQTNDGGQTWQNQNLNRAHFVTDIDFIDINNGWLVSGDDEIRHTSNGGADGWPYQMGPSNCCAPDLTGIDFIDANNGWAVGGDPDVYRTTDGGNSWIGQVSNLPSAYQSTFFEDVDIVNPNTAWIVGHGGTILKTTNGGNSWTSQNSGTTQNLNDVDFIDTNHGLVVGDSGTVLHTSDGGNTWVTETSGTTVNLRGVFYGTQSGWAVGDDGVIIKKMSTSIVDRIILLETMINSLSSLVLSIQTTIASIQATLAEPTLEANLLPVDPQTNKRDQWFVVVSNGGVLTDSTSFLVKLDSNSIGSATLVSGTDYTITKQSAGIYKLVIAKGVIPTINEVQILQVTTTLNSKSVVSFGTVDDGK